MLNIGIFYMNKSSQLNTLFSRKVEKLKRLNFSITIGDILYKVYERPGLWCSDSELSKMTNDMIKVAKVSQAGKNIPCYGALQNDRDDMKDRLLTIAYCKNSHQPLGFSAQKFLKIKSLKFSEEILHLGLMYTDPDVRGKNLSYLLNVFPNVVVLIKSGFRDIWISNVTQVPAALGMVDESYKDTFPNKSKKPQSFYHKKLSSLVFMQHKRRLVLEKMQFGMTQIK